MTGPFRQVVREAAARHRGLQIRACLYGAIVGAASVLLLGLSGWFLAAAALAGAAGPIAAHLFNYMLPAAGIRLLAIARTGARYGERLTGHAAALRTTSTVREKLFRTIAALPVAGALSLSGGEASAHLVDDVAAIEVALVRQTAPWALLFSLGAGGALMMLGGWRPLIALLVCCAGLFAAVEPASRRLTRIGLRVQQASSDLKSELAALTQSAPELRCYHLEPWAVERIGLSERTLGEAQRAATAMHGVLDAMIGTSAALAGVLCFMAAVPAGAPIAALSALCGIMAIDGAGAMVRDRAASGVVAGAVARLDAIFERREPGQPETGMLSGAVMAKPLAVDLHHRLAITGPSGCGKTSLIEGLIGLRPLPGGRITIDGLDVSQYPVAWRRSHFAWCPQDAMLFAGSVRANLMPALGDGCEADMWDALEDALLADRVRQMGGLDVWIGENGERLSGGERRRLALARAYLGSAPCLLLDEPTEGLDGDTERKVVEALSRRLARTGQGLILVSHRSEPLRLCERRIALGTMFPARSAIAA